MKKGIFLTLDVVVAMMLLFTVAVVAFMYFSGPAKSAFSSQLLRAYLQDAATAMSNRGDFQSVLNSANRTDSAGIREVLSATPSAVCMQVSSYGIAVPDGLAAYWKFDEDSGATASDSSGNGYVGAIIGNVQFSESAKSGRGFSFDGAGSRVDTGLDASWDESNSVSLSFWVKPNSTSVTNKGILGKQYADSEWSIYQAGDHVNLVYWDGTGGYTNGMNEGWGSVLSAGTWTHLAYVWDGNTSRFYSNGVLVNTKTATNPVINQDRSNSVQIGGNNYVSGDNNFAGSIDDVRFYNRALLASEVRELYSNPANLLYSVNKPDCAYSGGEIQTLYVPFSRNTNQNENNYYYAILKAWMKGARS